MRERERVEKELAKEMEKALKERERAEKDQ
jgi:hypothetical protein